MSMRELRGRGFTSLLSAARETAARDTLSLCRQDASMAMAYKSAAKCFRKLEITPCHGAGQPESALPVPYTYD